MNNSPRRHEIHEDITKKDFSDVSKIVVDIAYNIHQKIGSGLLECIYEEAFAVSLKKRNIPFERQKEIPVYFEGEKLNCTCRLDLLVANEIVIELKNVEQTIAAHHAQVLTYMKTANIKTGLLINFGEPYFKKAVKRFVL